MTLVMAAAAFGLRPHQLPEILGPDAIAISTELGAVQPSLENVHDALRRLKLLEGQSGVTALDENHPGLL